MKVLGYNLTWPFQKATEKSEAKPAPQSSAFMGDDVRIAGPWVPVNYQSYNGEKTPGELGNPTVLVPDYANLRIRAHEANFTNVVVKIITRRYFSWVVGSGLKLQSQPNKNVLEFENVKEDLKLFKKNVESYWSVFSDSENADFSGMQNLHELEADAYVSSFLGGDCLVVLRLDDKYDLKVQVIDGQHVRTPFLNTEFADKAKANGNVIIHGIEFDKNGKHVAFFVFTQTLADPLGKFERIEAVSGKTGLTMAWMIYAEKQRIDHKRGIPRIAAILETVKKLDRYTEAAVGSAEERAKIVLSIEHDKYSDGENPILANVKRKSGPDGADMGNYELANKTAQDIKATQGKTAYNLPIGAKLSALNSTAEINYDPFFKAVFSQIAASMDTPEEVALQKYNSNYSASRAAINAWGYLVTLGRKKHGRDFKQKIYNVWLFVHVMKMKVEAASYIKAVNEKNWLVLESYSAARWNGVNMPHIDPLKEANALRVMLGDLTTPLISYDHATEQLNNGDFEDMIDQVIEERKIIPPPIPPPANAVATLKGDNVEDKPAEQPPAKKDNKGKKSSGPDVSNSVLAKQISLLYMQLAEIGDQLENLNLKS